MTAIRLALGSIAIGCIIFALKYLAYALTGSVALFSDAIESIINIAAACAALVALRISALPADDNHPFGHSKAEYFSAELEGVLIVIAALAIARQAAMALAEPAPIAAPVEGLAVNALATVINLVWAQILLRHGRRVRSPALTADGRHLMADVVTSVGVIAGVALVGITGWLILDPILAILVAVNILWSGWRLIRESVAGLMDEAVPQETMDTITALIAEHASGAIQAHDVRTRRAGPKTFVEFHLVVPGDMSVSASHAICDRIEAAIRLGVPDSVTTIHVEPEYKAKFSAVQVASD
ncbi:cation diffusion facilitator family transporter [Amorphus coralli]|uniref:cation diffusion facilitator family transporter n=1 Tax=Amorphus coralli TaxID=340680 RepID=UPI00037100FC|nr:cation diffusion facilitator family transporter [Amorphus coralli]